jgi:hypothetical protein
VTGPWGRAFGRGRSWSARARWRDGPSADMWMMPPNDVCCTRGQGRDEGTRDGRRRGRPSPRPRRCSSPHHVTPPGVRIRLDGSAARTRLTADQPDAAPRLGRYIGGRCDSNAPPAHEGWPSSSRLGHGLRGWRPRTLRSEARTAAHLRSRRATAVEPREVTAKSRVDASEMT